jgi:hypothetical protein
MKSVEELPPDRVSEGSKDRIHAHSGNMQPFGCLFKA